MTDLILMWGFVGIVLVAGAVILFRQVRRARQAFLAGPHGLSIPEPRIPRWREDLDRFCDDSTVRWIVGFSVVSFFAYAFWFEYHRTIASIALGVLILAAGLLDQTTWRFWVLVLAGLVWLYGYRRNRRRQEAIIELLLEIRRKLE